MNQGLPDGVMPEMQRPAKPVRSSLESRLMKCLAALVLLILTLSCLFPSMGRARESAQRVKCASNLKQIGNAAYEYGRKHGGVFPPDWLTLLPSEDLLTEVFICPSSSKERAGGATTSEWTSAIMAGDHLSYVWVGGGLPIDVDVDVVLAFDLETHEPKDTARERGINVLWGDGHVSFQSEAVSRQIWTQFIAGVRPIRVEEKMQTSDGTP